MTGTNRTRPAWRGWLLGCVALAAIGLCAATPTTGAARPTVLPEFKHRSAEAWVNSAPLTIAGLRGKVVLVEVYTSG